MYILREAVWPNQRPASKVLDQSEVLNGSASQVV